MQKLIILLVLLFPINLWAQSNSEIQTAHQEAEQKLMSQHPQATKVDIALLTEQQKDLHKTQACKTCGAKKEALKNATTPKAIERNLVQLKAEQKNINYQIEALEAQENPDLGLLEKYNTALMLKEQQIKFAENHLKNDKKTQ